VAVVMVGPLMRLGTGGCVLLAGRICDHYGALQHKFVRCEKKR
jgi:hypothetical protein